MMRFLDRKWADGGHDEFTLELYHSVYVRHLMDIATELPPAVRTFALLSRGMLLAGSKIIATQQDEKAGTFTLILKVKGHDAQHYLQIEYQGVDFDGSDLDALHFADECLTEEFDTLPEESFEHRILLTPEGEVVIRFKDLSFHAKRAD